MKDVSISFIRKNSRQLGELFDELIKERTDKVLSMPAGEERDTQIAFVNAFKEWALVLKQVDNKKVKKPVDLNHWV